MNNYLLSLIFTTLYFLSIFIFAQIMKNNSIVDLAWGLGFVLVNWLVYFHSNNAILIPLLVSLWGLRLFFHLAFRNIGKKEDYRYTAMRKKWGKHQAINAFFKVFLFQAIMQFLVGLNSIAPQLNSISPKINSISSQNNSSYTLISYFGTFIFLLGFLTETIADYQLSKFVKTKNEGDVMTKGLWAYSRHPNYLGEALVWWGIYIISLSLSAPWWTLISPLLITILVRFISGVPILERRYANNLKYQEYAKRVPIFLPKFYNL